jgi:hypothetical protein
MLANKYNTTSDKFDFDTEQLEFKKLSELYNESPELIYVVKALFINTKSQFGDQGTICTPDFLSSAPLYLTETIEKMLLDDDIIEACNKDKLGFSIRGYIKDNEQCHTVVWRDL